MEDVRVCVVGGGISGLASAHRLAARFPNAEITVLYKEDIEDTTSHVAAGIWLPIGHTGTVLWERPEEVTFFNQTKEYFEAAIRSGESAKMGITRLMIYSRADDPSVTLPLEIPHQSLLKREEVLKIIPELEQFPDISHMWQQCVFICRPAIHLRWLKEQLLDHGVKFVQQEVNHFSDLTGYDVIINCVGIAARELANDSLMVPTRGQVTMVRAPWINFGLLLDFETYMLPGPDGTVTLGGSFQPGCEDRALDPRIKEGYMSRCLRALPSLKHAELVRDMVGVRPVREGGPRVEGEWLQGGSYVIHNYGHGANGWGMHWGSSGRVVAILERHLATLAR